MSEFAPSNVFKRRKLVLQKEEERNRIRTIWRLDDANDCLKCKMEKSMRKCKFPATFCIQDLRDCGYWDVDMKHAYEHLCSIVREWNGTDTEDHMQYVCKVSNADVLDNPKSGHAHHLAFILDLVEKEVAVEAAVEEALGDADVVAVEE